MKKTVSFVTILLLLTGISSGQFSKQAMDSIRKLTGEDYRYMLNQIGITSVRPGPSGTPGQPNSANYDESKAAQYTSVPDPLIMNNGKKVKSEKAWWKKRRPELIELFDRELYGRIPENVPVVTWKVADITSDTVGRFPVIVKKLSGQVDNSAYPSIVVNIDLTLTVPAGSDGPVPVIMEFGFVFPAGMKFPSMDRKGPQGPTWQEQVLEEGWGYAILVPVSVQADNGAGLRSGIIGLTNKGEPRKPDDWGALRAWAWGARIKTWMLKESALKGFPDMARLLLSRWLTMIDLPLDLLDLPEPEE